MSMNALGKEAETPQDAPRRLALLQVDPGFFVRSLITRNGDWQTYRISANGLPDDVRLAGVGVPAQYAAEYGLILIVVESESFELVKIGERLPILPPVTFESRPQEPFDHPFKDKCPACGGKTYTAEDENKIQVKRCSSCDWTKEVR